MGCAICKTLPPDVSGSRGSTRRSSDKNAALSAATSTPATGPTGTDANAMFDSNMSRYGVKRRTISTSRLRRGRDIWNYYGLTEEVLGTGISGAVRVAVEKESGRRFAIKTLSLEGIGEKKLAMLQNEVAVYLQLDHPNIAKLIEVYESPKAIHIVMELCTGRELYDRLAMKRKYSEQDAAKVTMQMLAAINYCHHHRVCHRDLKLENWVYADNEETSLLKLIDFGFSRIFNPGIPMTAMHGTVYYVSPEVMDGCYGERCDIWSIGVIVYMLLSGSPPFSGAVDHDILINIRKCAYSFNGPRWDGVSDSAKNFISCLLVKDPDKRLSAQAALQHPWLNSKEEDHELDPKIIENMRKFAVGNVMRRAALGLIAFSMTTSEIENLERQFKILDKNQTGTINMQDLVAVLIETLHVSPAEATRIFNKLDQTGDQEVHYTEFLASSLQARVTKDQDLVREAFQRFDVDSTGVITVENFRTVIGDVYDGLRVEEIVRTCDPSSRGFVTYDQFEKAVLSEDTRLLEPTPAAGPHPPDANIIRTLSKSVLLLHENKSLRESSSKLSSPDLISQYTKSAEVAKGSDSNVAEGPTTLVAAADG